MSVMQNRVFQTISETRTNMTATRINNPVSLHLFKKKTFNYTKKKYKIFSKIVLGTATGSYCGNVKCNAYEKCEMDRSTKRQKCVRN